MNERLSTHADTFLHPSSADLLQQLINMIAPLSFIVIPAA